MGRWIRSLFAGALTLMSLAAGAETYPTKQITIVVPFAAGSGTDTIARLIGQHLSMALNQGVVIDNRAGANGAIAATYVARAPADGYTLFMATNTTHSAAPELLKNISYDPLKDFAPITRVGSYTFVLLVTPDIPAKSLGELVAHAKVNPGKLTFASGNSTGIVAGETLKRRADIDIQHVPYKSTPGAINDMLGGRISMMFLDLTTGLSHIAAKSPLAVTTRERSPLLPELPSLHEAGLPNFDINPSAGLFAPANTPKEIVARLNAELRKIIDGPDVKRRLADAGFDAFSSTPEELDTFVKSELVTWTKLIKDPGIEPQ